MALRREEVCSNRQSAVIWGERDFFNRHITFIVVEKLNLQFILLYLRYGIIMWEEVVG